MEVVNQETDPMHYKKTQSRKLKWYEQAPIPTRVNCFDQNIFLGQPQGKWDKAKIMIAKLISSWTFLPLDIWTPPPNQLVPEL